MGTTSIMKSESATMRLLAIFCLILTGSSAENSDGQNGDSFGDEKSGDKLGDKCLDVMAHCVESLQDVYEHYQKTGELKGHDVVDTAFEQREDGGHHYTFCNDITAIVEAGDPNNNEAWKDAIGFTHPFAKTEMTYAEKAKESNNEDYFRKLSTAQWEGTKKIAKQDRAMAVATYPFATRLAIDMWEDKGKPQDGIYAGNVEGITDVEKTSLFISILGKNGDEGKYFSCACGLSPAD